LKPDVTFIAHGTNFIPIGRFGQEDFGLVGKERLFELIKEHKKGNVVFISGDVHYS